MGVGSEVGGSVGLDDCSIGIMRVGSGVVFSFGFKIWESNVGGIYGRLNDGVTRAMVVVVVSEMIGTIVIMVDSAIIWIGIGIVT